MSTIRNIRGGIAFIRDIGRLRQIVTVLGRHGFGEIVERLNLGSSVVGKLTGVRPEDGERIPPARRTLLAIQELGPTFVKLGQILSTRPDLIPHDFVVAFQELQDRVTPLETELVRGEIESSLGKPVDELFAHFEDAALASASIAQVHRARLHGGEEVVLKVRRPGIRPIIERDLDILKFLAQRIDDNVPEVRVVDLPAIVQEFERAILKEVDFTHEANHLERFAQNFENVAYVHIPVCYRELSTDSVLAMEFIDGVKITETDAVGDERERLVKNAIHALFMMVYEHGFFHGDLHPGNLLVTKDGIIGLIDCGLAGRLTPTLKDQIVDLMVGVSRRDYESVAEVMYEIGIKRGPVDFNAFLADTIEVMDDNFVGKTLGEVQFGAFFTTLVERAMRHRIQVPPETTMLFKSVMTVEGIGKQLAPDVDIVAEARPFVERLLRERYSPDNVGRRLLSDARNLGRFLRQFPTSARQLMSAMERGDVTVGVRAQGFEQLAHARITGANRLSLAVIESALIIAGTMSLPYGLYPIEGLGGFSAVSLALYLLAAGAAGIFWGIFLRRPKVQVAQRED